jgi:signal transduction histidine kinase
VQTPKKFIKDISDLAIKYTLYISIFTFLIGALVIYFIADRTTKPIRKMQQIANNISNLDFSYRCDVQSSDEIGLLSGSINNMSAKLQDFVSQLLVANEKLKDDLTRQEKTDKMRKQFIANVSHDFKTPLTLIMSYSEALIDMKDMDESTKIEYLNIIMNEGNKMSEFVQELLKLSQLESGMIKLEKTNFSINEIINDTIRKNKIIAESKNLIIEKSISNNSIVFADYYRISQVFQNLYENAIKYSSNNSIIKISTSNNLDKCIIKINNTGKIISDEDLENIFISFYRSDKSRKNMGSYGLGLAIVKIIMDMHGENFGVKNVNNGVEFWFELENIQMEAEMEE